MTTTLDLPGPEDLIDAGVRLDLDGPVLTVWLARPEVRNAQTPAMWRALARVGSTTPPHVRVVLLRGEGASFSAGLDRRMLEAAGIPGETGFVTLARGRDDDLDAAIAGYQEAFTWLRSPRFVTIAAVQGHAVGAGFQLALACDLRILTADAQLSMRETALGLVPDLTGTHRLVAAVGYARALEICATSRWVGAEEASRIGLAELVVPDGALDAAITKLAGALTAAPHEAVTAVKDLLQGAQVRSYDDQRAAERATEAGRLRALAELLG